MKSLDLLFLTAEDGLRSSAVKNIRDKLVLEETLRNNNIPFKQFDVKPLFTVFSSLMRNDRISATPTCVIEQNGGKESFTGGPKILTALQELIPSKP